MPKTANIENHKLPSMMIRADIASGSFNEEARTVDVVFATETPVKRYSWADDMVYNEILSLDPAHVRTERLRAGAPVLDSHNRYRGTQAQLGKVENFEIADNQGRATLRFSKRESVRETIEDVRDGILTGISVGYRVHRLERVSDAPDGTRQYKAVDWEPMEISLAPVPADINSGVRSEGAETFPVEVIDNLSTIQNRAAMPENNSATPPVTTTEPIVTPPTGGEGNRSAEPTAEQRAAIAAEERSRVTSIRTAVRLAGLDEAFAEPMIDSGVALDSARAQIFAELEKRSAANGANGANRAQVGADRTREAEEIGIVSALSHRADSSVQLVEQGRQFAYMTMIDVARHVVETRQGVSTRGMSPTQILERAHSTSDFPNLLSNVMNKFLRDGYAEAPSVWKNFAKKRNANDFKEIMGVQFGGSIVLDEIKEGSEYKLDTLEESAEKLKLKTYGKMLAVTRQMIINDDLDGLARLPQRFGRAAADVERRIIFNLLLANGGAGVKMSDGKFLFATEHKNLAATGGAISTGTLSAARTAIRRQTGLKNEKLNLLPKFLMVPPELETLADQTLSNIVVPDSSQNVNVFRNKLTVLVDPELEDPKRWYVFADPAQIDMIGYAYLNGTEGLYTETKYGYEVDGVTVKARLDFGATVWDHRGMYKNDGPTG